MDRELHYASLIEVAAGIAARELSPVALTRQMLDRVAEVNPKLNAYLAVTADHALAEAEAAEAEIRAGRYRGPLHGVPIAIKDLFHTKGSPSTFGSSAYKSFVADEDATLVHRLRDRGRGDPGPPASARGRVRRASSRPRSLPQSLEQGLLAGRLLLGVGIGDGGGALLREPGHRHRRLDPFPLGGLRRHRPEGDLGQNQPIRRVSARRFPRHDRSDGAKRGRRGRDVRRDGGRRSARSDLPRGAGPALSRRARRRAGRAGFPHRRRPRLSPKQASTTRRSPRSATPSESSAISARRSCR